MSEQRDAANTIRRQEEELQKLQDRVSVLAHAKETDGRRFRQIAVERQREREELKREVDRLKVCPSACHACAFLRQHYLVGQLLAMKLTAASSSTHAAAGYMLIISLADIPVFSAAQLAMQHSKR